MDNFRLKKMMSRRPVKAGAIGSTVFYHFDPLYMRGPHER